MQPVAGASRTAAIMEPSVVPVRASAGTPMSDSPEAHAPWIAAIADALVEGRVAVLQDVLAEPTLTALHRRALAIEAAGRLHPAAIGRGAARSATASIRGDRIAWMEEAGADPCEHAYLDAMAALMRGLNRDLMLGLAELESHYAVYPAGARYAAHRDRFRDDDARVVSVILYLNADWQEDDGGALRVQLGEGGTLDVLPRAGTLVAFAAERFVHEVLPARRRRVSVTGWFRRRGAAFEAGSRRGPMLE